MRHPLSLEAFADWCDKQPEGSKYNYLSMCGDCALDSYAKSLGIGSPYVEGFNKASQFWNDADLAASRPGRTYASLASRLRASIQEA